MKIIKSIIVGVAWALTSHSALATTLNFDFGQSAVDAYNTAHGTSYSTGVNPGQTYTDAASGVTAMAYYYDTSSGTWTSNNTNLWARYEPNNDMGLGVCSPGEGSHCVTGAGGNGDWNELSQETNQEIIVLQRPAGYSWDQLLVSSLDNNNGAGPEHGTLYWSGSSDGLLASSFLAGLTTSSDYFTFANGDFAGGSGTINGDVLQTANGQASGFDPNSKYVAFVSGGPVGSLGSTSTTSSYGRHSYSSGCSRWHPCTSPTTSGGNNDYTVWQGALTSIPEPGTLALMGAGLAGLMIGRYNKRH